MSHEVEQMAYRFRTAVDVPWHGLGTKVEANLSTDEWLKVAGLDWAVQRRKLYMRRDKAETHPSLECPGYHAITRSSDGKVFAVMSDGYIPVQNKTIMDFFRRYCEAGQMELETAGSLKGGSLIWALAKVGQSFTLPGQDKVESYLMLYNGHDGGRCFGGKFTGVRVVCNNTFQASMTGNGAEFKMRHSRAVTPDVIRDAKKRLGMAVETTSRVAAECQMMAEAKVDPRGQEVYQYVARIIQPELLANVVATTEQEQALKSGTLTAADVLNAVVAQSVSKPKRLTQHDFNAVGKSVLDAILNSPGADTEAARGSWWGAYNGVTYWADHTARSRDGADGRLTSAWFGQRAAQKQEAYRVALAAAQGGNVLTA